MNKFSIKLALAVSLLAIPTNASASMPDEIPSSWYVRMMQVWTGVASHRTCKNKIVYTCDGHLWF